MSFRERKEERKKFYKEFIEGWKLRKCYACNGSGYYDRGGRKCSACEGTGKERYKSDKEKE